MTLVAHARLSATPGAVQVFVADFGAIAAGTPQFSMGGQLLQACALRPLSSVRPPAQVASGQGRAFTGVYELSNLEPGVSRLLDVTLGAQTLQLNVGPPPLRIPSDADGGFDVLLASCFCAQESHFGTLNAATQTLLRDIRPKPGRGRRVDCSFFMGDQVYLDLPTLKNFPNDAAGLARLFEADYVNNWRAGLGASDGEHTGLAGLMRLAPSVCLPDDHEFWNNAPHVSPLIQNSFTEAGRQTWFKTALSMLDAFQRPLPAAAKPGDDPFVFDVEPVSFFLADGRSGRGRSVLTAQCRAALSRWVTSLNDRRYVGVFVTGQSLFRAAASGLSGHIADYEMPNYEDYAGIVETLQRARLPLLALTGDVHFGRVTSAADPERRLRMQEVIVSPLSLVTTVGGDQLQRAASFLRGLFSAPDPWPRHAAGDAPPQRFGSGAGAYKNSSAATSRVKGDQLGRLAFAFDAGRRRLQASIIYYFIHQQRFKPLRIPLLDLSLSI